MATPRVSSLDGLHPAFRERLELGLAKARAAGLAVHVFETVRSPERQDELYAVGRKVDVHERRVTNAEAWGSWHQYGLAADLAFDGDVGTPKVEWTWTGDWRRLASFLTAEGLDWLGADGSTFPEAPHYQLTGGLWIKEARRLKVIGGLPMVWEAVDQRLANIARSLAV